MVRLNLGAGKKVLDGYDNYDICPVNNQVRYIDLNKKLPFRKDYADEILLDNVLEHIKEYPKLMTELNRILKPDGQLRIFVPYFAQPSVWRREHYHVFNLSNAKQIAYGFIIKEKKLIFLYENTFFPLIIFEWFPKMVSLLAPKFYEWYLSHIFPASNMYLELTK